jgi:hypothetical protein
MTLFQRRSVFAFVLGATLAAAVLVGRSAFATTETISACFKPSNGTLYLLGESSGRHECQPGDIPISWNTAGVNGQDGVSVRSEQLAPGDDAACPNGGSKFTAANDVSYACNGSDGEDGVDGVNGQDGADGQDFNGSFTSPNGRFKLIIDDTAAKIEGRGPGPGDPVFRVILDGSGARMEGPAGNNVQVGGNNAQIRTTGALSASGSQMTIGGSQQIFLGSPHILLNGGGCGVLRSDDVVLAVGPGGGPIRLNAGSPIVQTPCPVP